MLISNAFSLKQINNAVLVVGGGVAGMQAALSLATLGEPVIIIEKNSFLGGKVMRLDKVYPTDHCAFCPAWTTSRQCYESDNIYVLLNAELIGFETDADRVIAKIRYSEPLIDPFSCLYCGACKSSCAEGALLSRDMQMTWDPALPPSMRIDSERCSNCGKCMEACPVKAIKLNRPSSEIVLPISDVVYATGFREPLEGEKEYAAEFGGYSHPDICTAMEFEAWHGEHNAQKKLLTKSDGREVRSLAFVQCAGARDVNHLNYCAAVCCMHGMKQARRMKRRQPDLNITIFYTDLRAPGAGQEAYIRAGQGEDIRLVRSRPGLIIPSPDKGIVVRCENPENGKAVGEVFDMVIINGGLGQCPLPGVGSLPQQIRNSDCLSCGFCSEPVDIAGSVIQGASSAALLLRKQRVHQKGGV